MITCFRCKKTKPEDQFYIRRWKTASGEVREAPEKSRCIQCNKDRWKDAENAGVWRSSHYLMNYGMTLDDYDDMCAEQNNSCGICGKHATEFTKRLSVDHDHDTGVVRGLLCSNCNAGIGLLGDNIEALERAITYLQGL